MDWQLLLVLLSVAVAGGYVGRQAWRTWAGRGCASGCGGCAPTAKQAQADTIVPLEEVKLRRRSVL